MSMETYQFRRVGPYHGNGVTVAFTFDFLVFTETDVEVTEYNTSSGAQRTPAYSIDYAVTLNPDQNTNPGGTVTALAAPATGIDWTITSAIEPTQPLNASVGGSPSPTLLEATYDRCVALVQQALELSTRALTLPIPFASTVSTDVPAPVAGALLGWDGLATALVNITGLSSKPVSAYMESVLLSANAIAARSLLGVGPGPRVQSLLGDNEAGLTTSYTLSADLVILRDSNGATVAVPFTGQITVNIGTAGPVANGRDRAGALSINSWVYLYFIWNGTLLRLIASPNIPSVGPVLPAGYTAHCYATTLRVNGAGNLETAFVRGREVRRRASTQVLTGGVAVIETVIALAAVIPPNALRAKTHWVGINSSTRTRARLRIYTGSDFRLFEVGVGPNAAADCDLDIPNVHASNQMYYINDAGTVTLDGYVSGYDVPNGDS